MFKSLAFISVLTSAVLAQSTANVTSSTTNSLIPSDISAPCATFLNELNSDPTLASCITTLKNVTSAFAPGATTPSQSDATSTLTNLCADPITGACPVTDTRQWLAKFYAACPTELTTNPNSDVTRIYEVLYALSPLRTSVCSKDDFGNFCGAGPTQKAREVNEDSDNPSIGFAKIMALLYMKHDNGALARRNEAPVFVPNLTTFGLLDIAFLFLNSDLNATQLCVTCTRDVLTAYINFESDTPDAIGVNSSLILGSQSALFTAVQSKCPANFLSGAVAAAGGLSGTGGTSSAIPTYGAEYQHIIALMMGAVTLIVSVVL